MTVRMPTDYSRHPTALAIISKELLKKTPLQPLLQHMLMAQWIVNQESSDPGTLPTLILRPSAPGADPMLPLLSLPVLGTQMAKQELDPLPHKRRRQSTTHDSITEPPITDHIATGTSQSSTTPVRQGDADELLLELLDMLHIDGGDSWVNQKGGIMEVYSPPQSGSLWSTSGFTFRPLPRSHYCGFDG